MTVGEEAIVAAGAVGPKNVDLYSMVGGSSAKFIKKLKRLEWIEATTDKKTINTLTQFA